MSDSDNSDYIVEEFIKPETVRHTYKKDEDLISASDSDSGNEKNESASEEDEVDDDSEAKKNTQCVLNNVEPEQEPARPNNRFILYVTNLSGETTKTMLEDFFGDCGKVKSIRIPKVRLGCYAFVEMVDFEGFKAGLKLNNKEIDGKKIQVYEGSKNKKHTSTKAKDLKRKNQQKYLDNLKPKRNKIE